MCVCVPLGPCPTPIHLHHSKYSKYSKVSLFNYLKKSFYKTASLLAAACRASAVLTGLRGEVCDARDPYFSRKWSWSSG